MSKHSAISSSPQGQGSGSDRVISFATTAVLCLATAWPWQWLGQTTNAFRLQLWGAGACLALTAVLARRVRLSRSWLDRGLGLLVLLALSPLAMAGTLPGPAATLAFPLALFATAALWTSPSPLSTHCSRMVLTLSPAVLVSLAALPTANELCALFLGGYLLSLLPWERLLPHRDGHAEGSPSALAGVILPMTTILFALFSFQEAQAPTGSLLFIGGRELRAKDAAALDDRLPDLLRATGHEVHAGKGLISRSSLEKQDCIVLRPPCRPLAASELSAIDLFVNDGGGLLVLGEAMNRDSALGVFNPVIERFGVRLSFDRVTGDMEACRHTARRHPCLWRVAELGFGRGASLHVRPPAKVLIQSGPSLFGDRGKVSSSRAAHQGNGILDGNERVGDLARVAVSEHGRGRVAVLGDASMLSGARLADNAAFCHRLFSWLGRHRPGIPWHWPVAALSVVFFLFAWHSRPDPRQILLAWCVALPMAWHGAGLYNDVVLGADPTRLLQRSVLVDGGHGSASVPVLHGPLLRGTDLSPLYEIFAALDLWPRTVRGPIHTDDLLGARLFVTVAPRRPYGASERKALETFVRAGGALLVFQGPSLNETPAKLLEAFGLRPGTEDLSLLRPPGTAIGVPIPVDHPPDPIYTGIEVLSFPRPTSVRGGAVLASTADVPVMARTMIGQGRVILVGDHLLPTARALCPTTDPDAMERRRFLWNLIELLAKEEA